MPTIKLWGVELNDVPRGVIAAIALGLAALVIVVGYWTQVRRPEVELVTAQEATQAAMAEIEEYGKHIAGTDVEHEHRFSEKPLLLARLYKDRCFLLVSETPDGERSTFVRDMAKDPHKAPKRSAMTILPVLHAATNCDNRVHPGRFDTKYGVKDGCWVPVYYIYGDGCVSMRMFDACNRILDGRVTWMPCRH